MRYTVNQLIKDVDRKLHTGGVSQTQDFYGALDEGRRAMVGKIKPVELVRTAFIEQALYDQVDKYAAPDDMAYDDVVEIKAISSRRNVDTLDHPLEQVYQRRFDQKRRKAKNVFSIIFENGVKYMKISNPRKLEHNQHLLINDVNSLTSNGTWNTGGNLVNLREDKLNYVSGKGSLSFDFNNSGTTGFIENFTMESVDLEDYFGTGAVFTWFNISNFLNIISVRIELGSSLTDWYEYSVNQPNDNNEFVNNWNLLRFPLNNMTQNGTPNPKAINRVKIEFTTTGVTIDNCNIDNIIARKGMVYAVTYNSPFCFMSSSTRAWKQFATTNTDIIPLEEDGYQILMLETAKTILKESYGNSDRGNNDISNIEIDLKAAYKEYGRNHKSENIEPYQSTYVFGDMYSGYTDDSLADNHHGGDSSSWPN